MQEIKKETQVQEMTYEEALKAFKESWKEKRKAEATAKRNEAKTEKREKTVEACKKSLEALKEVDSAYNKELAPVVTRLNMFINGEKYTRKGGNN